MSDKQLLSKLVDNLIDTNEKNTDLISKILQKLEMLEISIGSFKEKIGQLESDQEKVLKIAENISYKEIMDILKDIKDSASKLENPLSFMKKLGVIVAVLLPIFTVLASLLLKYLTK